MSETRTPPRPGYCYACQKKGEDCEYIKKCETCEGKGWGWWIGMESNKPKWYKCEDCEARRIYKITVSDIGEVYSTYMLNIRIPKSVCYSVKIESMVVHTEHYRYKIAEGNSFFADDCVNLS